MSNNFKPLAEQTSEKMIAALKAGNSIFHKPMVSDVESQFKLPRNPSTGKSYKGPAALVLLMANREDPRWMSLKQASFSRNPVLKGEKGTLINFYKNSEIKPVIGEDGQHELKENGKPKMASVKLEKPVLTDAWLFNAAQLKDMTELIEPRVIAPTEKAQQLMDASNVTFEAWELETFYEPVSDTVRVANIGDFKTLELYYATAMHELAHATGHESRMNRPIETENGPQVGKIKEELRTNLASILISAELDLPYDFGYHKYYAEPWAALLKDNPNELFKAMVDAQKIANYVLNFGRQAEKKQEAGVATEPRKLAKGDVILYNDVQYKVKAELKNKVYQMEDLSDGRKFKMSSKDNLYGSLLEAKYNPMELARDRDLEEFERELETPEDAITFKWLCN